MLQRHIQSKVITALDSGMVAILYGARQVGKTTLAKQIAKRYKQPLYLNCDDPTVVSSLTEKSAIELKSYLGDADLVIIDEAQRVTNIGISLKLLHDTYPDIRLLVTGSSSLDLSNKITEPLTGRSVEIPLQPLSLGEVAQAPSEYLSYAKVMMLRGGYPGMWSLPAEEAYDRLSAIATNYLYRDAFAPHVIYDHTIINDLLRLLAYQIGSEVNYSELGRSLGITNDTVKRYIDLLEKAFIIFRRNQYRRNQRAEVGRLRKVYFTDLGIRNALIDDFKPLELRDDTGALWENFCIIERLKYLQAASRRVRSFYWRGDGGAEVDLVEEESGVLRGMECKYGMKKPRVPAAFSRAYPEAHFSILSPDTLLTELFDTPQQPLL
ncbi:MAG: ATP-binding protein [Candidatus Saccharibacteria bacterium]|nr:ATP-binding protein [Candidatus Saccharibacteria bacterium]